MLINFWATWCASCRGEMPDLDELHAELGDPDVSILDIATDRDPALDSEIVALPEVGGLHHRYERRAA